MQKKGTTEKEGFAILSSEYYVVKKNTLFAALRRLLCYEKTRKIHHA